MKMNWKWMAAAAVVLFGMQACGNKASESTETAEAAETPAEGIVVEELAVDPEAPEVEAPAVGDEATASDYTTTASGLKYKVIKKGTGKTPKATDIVKVNYEGKLTNGQVFDSSYQRGEPAEFPLNAVIPGWTEGLQLMQEGATYEFLIPSNLAYGERGAGGMIPPNSDLIFKVDLIEVK